MSPNLWWVSGIFLAIAIVGIWFWWHGRHSKKMEDKPQPKSEPPKK